MPPASLPPNESERLAALQRYQILDTMPEKEFDTIAEFAARSAGVPVALISLLDANRQWFKSCIGMQLTETPREVAFCAYTILSDQLLMVPDTTQDVRFADNPLVTEAPYIRFYAGVPLQTREGYNIGTLCLVDFQPRQLSAAQQANLLQLGQQVMTRLELRLATLELRQMNQQYKETRQVSS